MSSRLGLVDADLDFLGGAVDQVLGVLEAEAGDLADDLDDADLVGAAGLEDDGELRLLLGRGRSRAAAAAGAAATATGAALTPHLSSSAFVRLTRSMTVRFER